MPPALALMPIADSDAPVPLTTVDEPKATLAAGLTGRFGQYAQLGAVGVMALVLLVGMTAVIWLVREERNAAHEDRVSQRQADRDERRFERETQLIETRSMRDVLGRVVQALDRLDRSQAEHAARLADLARIVERIERRIGPDPEPESIAGPDGHPTAIRGPPLGPPTWLVAALVNLAPPSGADDVVRPRVEFTPGPSAPAPPAAPAKGEPPTDGPARVPAGRFVWASVTVDRPVTYHCDVPEIMDPLRIPPDGHYAGIKFDEPAGARPKHHAPPATAKGDACALLASRPGLVRVTVWVNAGEGKPPELLAQRIFEVFDPDAEVLPPKPLPGEVKPGETKPDVVTPPPAPVPAPVPGLAAKLAAVAAALPEADRKTLPLFGALAMDAAAALCDDAKLLDVGALEAAVQAKAKREFQGDRLRPFGPVLGEFLLVPIGSDNPQTPLSADLRAKLKSAYRAAAAAFREVSR